MKATFVSSQSITQALRYQMLRMQSELVGAQQEMSTLRVADPGLTLGARNGQSVSFARDVSRLNVLIDSNQLVASRLSSTQTSLQQIASRAEEFRTSLTAAISSGSSAHVVQGDASSMVEAVTAILNTSINGEYLFAGINTDVQPIADFNDPAAPNRVAFDQAFLTHFGFAVSDPTASAIAPSQMTTFLDTVVEPLFLGAGWSQWSSATDESIQSRIALNETTETSVGANIDGVRRLMMAATISSSLLAGSLNSGTKTAIMDKSLALVAEGVSAISDQQTRTGIVERRVSAATDRLKVQADLLEKTVNSMEGVDPYEASTRVSALVTQIEASYSITARIQQLSLLRLLS